MIIENGHREHHVSVNRDNFQCSLKAALRIIDKICCTFLSIIYFTPILLTAFGYFLFMNITC